MNKSTTVNESPNMQLEYQRLVCVPFPELHPYNDKHSTFSNKDKDDAQSTKSKAKVVSSKTAQDNKKEKETYNYNTSDCFKWEDDGDPLPPPRRHSFFDFETTRRSQAKNVIQSSPSFCSIGRRSSLQVLGTTNESEEECNAIDDFLYVMLLRR